MMYYYPAAILLALIQCNWFLSLSATFIPAHTLMHLINHFGRKATHDFLHAMHRHHGKLHDFSKLELDLGLPVAVGAKMRDIVHGKIKPSVKITGGHPHAGIMPHLIGVHSSPKVEEVHLDQNVHLDHNVHTLSSVHPKVHSKIHSLSSVHPRVHSLHKEVKTTSYPVEYIHETPSLRSHTNWKRKEIVRNFKHKSNDLKKLDRELSRLAMIYNMDDSTTESSMVTVSELLKQIPAPPPKVHTRVITQTTPAHRYSLMRTNTSHYTFLDV